MSIEYDKESVEKRRAEEQRLRNEAYEREQEEQRLRYEAFRKEELAKHKELLDELRQCADEDIQRLTGAFYHREGWGYGSWNPDDPGPHPNNIISEAPERIADYKAMKEVVDKFHISKQQMEAYFFVRRMIGKAERYKESGELDPNLH